MPTFENQVEALIQSAHAICERAQNCNWDSQEWGPVIILGHVLDVDNEVWMPRFEMMRIAMNKKALIPQLSWWEPDAAETEKKYEAISLDTAKTNLLVSRNSMQNYLMGLSENERRAAAHHKTFGTITIESMLQVILDHDEEHRASLN
jgi:hypothetical protein